MLSVYLKWEIEPLRQNRQWTRAKNSKSGKDITSRILPGSIMKTVFTVIAFVFACSLMLSEFTQEAEGIGFIIEIAKKKKTPSSSNSGGRRNKNTKLKHQLRHLLAALKKSQKRERTLRKWIQKVSFLIWLIFSYLKSVWRLDCNYAFSIEVYILFSQKFRQAMFGS